jgi:hypothetical protein
LKKNQYCRVGEAATFSGVKHDILLRFRLRIGSCQLNMVSSCLAALNILHKKEYTDNQFLYRIKKVCFLTTG